MRQQAGRHAAAGVQLADRDRRVGERETTELGNGTAASAPTSTAVASASSRKRPGAAKKTAHS